MGDSQIGLHARLMSQALRKLAGIINKSSTIAIFINQLREKVGVMYGNPEVTTGGRALKFYATIRMDVRRKEDIKEDGNIIGVRTRVNIKKNKVAPPFKEAEFDNIFGEGISRESSILDIATDFKIINKSGAWFAYNGEKIGQGRDNARKYLKENPEICEEIRNKVMKQFIASEKNKESLPSTDDTDPDDSAITEEDPLTIDENDFEALFSEEEESGGLDD